MTTLRASGTLFLLLLILAPMSALADAPSAPEDICALMEGEQTPSDLVVLDQMGSEFDLTTALTSKPTLLIFYRGGW